MLVSPTLPNTSLSNREIYPRNKTERSYLVLLKDDIKTHYFVKTGPVNGIRNRDKPISIDIDSTEPPRRGFVDNSFLLVLSMSHNTHEIRYKMR